MRVVAGAAKGRRLVAPAGADTRPTADRVKEALFSSLGPLLPGARVLDLYAGSGSLGLEALSRGAERVTFVERDRAALRALERNVATVALPGTTLVTSAVATALRGDLDDAPFDLVLLDPPYRMPQAQLASVLQALTVHLAVEAAVVLERAARDGAVPWPETLRPGTPRRYGDTALHRADLVPDDDVPAAGDASGDDDPGEAEQEPT